MPLLVQLWKIEDTINLPPLLLHFRAEPISAPLYERKSQNQTAGVRLSVIDKGLSTIHPISEFPRQVDVASLRPTENFTDGDR